MSALQGNFPTTHLRRRHAFNGTWPAIEKRCAFAGSSVEELKCCQSGEGKKQFCFSRRNSIEVMISLPLDVLKQFFGDLRENVLVASAQSLNARWLSLV